MRRHIALAASLLAAGAAHAQPRCTLCVDEPPRLEVAADGTASGTASLCRSAPGPAMLALRLSDFSMPDAQGRPFVLRTTRRIEPANAADRAVVDGTAPMTTRCVAVRLEVSGLRQVGLARATLYDGDAVVARIEAVRQHAPFGLRLDGPNPERADLQLLHDQPFSLSLHNDDDMAYTVRWRLDLPGLPAEGTAWIAPRRSAILAVPKPTEPPVHWLEAGFLRSATREGRLVVEYLPDPSVATDAWPRKEFPVRASIGWLGPAWQGLVHTVVIVALLLLGIAASLLINYALPMQRRRVALKQRLALLEGRMTGLGSFVPRRLLNLLRVEKKRLREELRGLWPVDPTTEALLPKLEAQVDWVDHRITLATRVGEHLAALAASPLLAVAERDQGRAACERVFEIVARPQGGDEDRQRAQAALGEVSALREAASQPPSTAALQALSTRAARLREPLAAGPRPAGHEPAFEATEAALLQELPAAELVTLSRAEYVDLALALAKGEVIVEYKRLLRLAPSAEVLALRTARADDLLKALRPGEWQSLDRAREIVCEVEQGVSPDGLAAALRNGEAPWIEIDPPRPLPYQLVRLRLRLRRPGLDTADARSRIQCRWQVAGTLLETDDWEATCFFEPNQRGIVVQATLQHDGQDAGEWSAGPFELEVAKSYAAASTWLSLGSLLVTMLIVGIGLLAGAQEKIQSLDWVAGTIACLALGFGADALKRVITRP